MKTDAVEVRPLEAYRVYVRFADGTEGEVDLSQHMEFTGIFEPLKAHGFFRQVRVDEFGGLCWPNGADICPDVLYSYATGLPIDEIVPAAGRRQVHTR